MKIKKLFPYSTSKIFVTVLSIGLITLNACRAQSPSPDLPADLTDTSADQTQKLKVLATTSIVTDVVSQVGGDLIDLSTLLPAGADPHTFDPNPSDLVKVADAELIFANGAGLEEFLNNLIESAGAQDKIFPVSESITLLDAVEGQDIEHIQESGSKDFSSADPHTWTDPNNVKIWVENILSEFNRLDPVNAAEYSANAASYLEELDSLDGWVREQVNRIPREERLLVTDHTLFTYFTDEYGFSQVGAVVPGYSTMAEPSAKELAELEDAIRQLGAKAVFVGNTVNSNLARQVADDTGIALVFIYTGSLSEPGGEASTYLDYMRYNVSAIVEALSN